MVDIKSTEVDPDNVIPITMDMLTSEQKQGFEGMINQLQNRYLHSFVLTRSGTVIQRHKVDLPPVDEKPESSSANDDKLKEVKAEGLKREDDGAPEFNNLQDRSVWS
jgi:hypothetical protein|uniref:Uncharacterized protein n=1 Tax=Oryza sativa subsp. japonica TaxID=39947 RepID=Q6ZFB1_ORYSJ|nr:hypothetical protein [Oryza sativa Japonica Group]